MKSAFATSVARPNAKTNTIEIVFFILLPFQKDFLMRQGRDSRWAQSLVIYADVVNQAGEEGAPARSSCFEVNRRLRAPLADTLVDDMLTADIMELVLVNHIVVAF